MHRTFLVLALCASAHVVGAQGFARRDLSTLGDTARGLLGTGYVARADSARVILACTECDGAPMIHIRLGRQTDGTEARVRAGTTTIASLEAQCRARDAGCRLERRDVGAAVGWRSRYTLGALAGTTAILLRDGDMLVMRAVASTRAVADAALDRLLDALAPTIVGR